MKARLLTQRQSFLPVLVLAFALLSPGCADRELAPAALTADLPLHLEDYLDAATIVGSEVPEDIPAPVEWRFDESQPEWRPATPLVEGFGPVEYESQNSSPTAA